MSKNNLLYFNDTETSGENIANGQIITSAFIVTDFKLNELARYQAKINFKCLHFVWQAEAEAVHKIPQSLAMIHGCELANYFRSLKAMHSDMTAKYGDHKAVFLAQNAFFDFGMHKTNERVALGDDSNIMKDIFGYKPFDTSVLFASLGNWNRSGLSNWVSKDSQASDKRHDAMYDTELLVNSCRTHLGSTFARLFG